MTAALPIPRTPSAAVPAPAIAGLGFEPCLSPAERAMAKVLAALLRRSPLLLHKPEALLTLARHGIAGSEPDPELAARRARRVVLLVLCRAAAGRRARLGG